MNKLNFIPKNFSEGYGVKKDYTEAMKWCLLAAEQGAAQNLLGFMYLNERGVKRDEVEAFKWIRLAAEQNYVPAIENIVKMYREGIGVEQNISEAFKWVLHAAELGNPEAQFSMGLSYFIT